MSNSRQDTSRRGSLAEHDKVVNEIILTLGSTDMCRVWRNETGKGIKMSYYMACKKNEMSWESLDRGIFSYGLKGSADILGILNDGRFLAIEVKTGNAKQSKIQKNFGAMIQKFGGVYMVCKNKKEALHNVKQLIS